MNQLKKVALLGATGKAGKYLLTQLLHQGYIVRALIRKPENYSFTHPSLEIISGDIKDLETARSLLEGCDAVLSMIGQKPEDVLISSLATSNIVHVIEELSSKRYVLLSGITLDTPDDKKSEKVQQASAWMRQTCPEVTADKQKAYELLSGSSINWTIVRVPWIEQTEERRGTITDLLDCPGESISTTDLADFFVSQLKDGTYFRKAPFVASL
jgi:putative NADH-flavin reductase